MHVGYNDLTFKNLKKKKEILSLDIGNDDDDNHDDDDENLKFIG